MTTVVPDWPHTSMLFMTVPVPYYDENYNIVHYPISAYGYYPLYGTVAEAQHRLSLYGKNTSEYAPIQIPSPFTDSTFKGGDLPATGQTYSDTYYHPWGLGSAVSNSDPKDFSKAWDGDVTGMGSPVLPHPGFSSIDTGFYNPNNGNLYDFTGDPLTL